MPYKFNTDKIPLPPSKDRRRKLTDAQKVEILNLYSYEKTPIREIARRFDGICSRRLIQMVIFPERRERAGVKFKAWQKKNGNYRQRVGNKNWAKVMREHRQYKQSILKDNK